MTNLLTRWLGLIGFILGGSAVIISGWHQAISPFEDWPAFDTPLSRLITCYSYFTLWSNIIGAIVCLLFAFGFGTNTATWAKVLRIDAAMMLIVTGLIYNTLLAGGPLLGIYRYTNPVEHIIMPILLPILWLISMRERSEKDIHIGTIFKALIIPFIWCVYTYIRGAVTGGFYPYFFLDVSNLGYVRAIANTLGVYVLFFVLIGILAIIEGLITKAVTKDKALAKV
ncbi:MAG: Pr6Pr family membrane protein [Corynebacterium sp.]|nr:Pr6Pr family membrane protein [Corynebacterium sp.]